MNKRITEKRSDVNNLHTGKMKNSKIIKIKNMRTRRIQKRDRNSKSSEKKVKRDPTK